MKLMVMYYLKNIVLCFDKWYVKYVFLWHDYYEWCFIIALLNVLFRENFLRLTMGFEYFMYSHSLVPVIDLWFSGRDKVGIRAMVSLLILNCRFVFSYTTAVLGCQMSVLSSLLPVLCVVSVCYCVWFYLVCLLWMRSRARDAPAVEAVDNVE